ncbi:polyphosphate kinase 2 [Sodalis ligni]|jgi:polyphosphate kinase 2|uniref:ADP/GDP-polyphosphate phosphotransferase n=1 Tax=Sodalis ligni TaxID=2697027 RepID=A0A4R1N8Y3_9GAMM|nr:polyphosphate kinase 2 [Sodalis ligni]QWA13271.1 polyphosphate kinase 2 [Sodalis ligni]TCL03069.1 polyphosphate kinase 2 [Sodalis ligni]
MSKSNDHQPDHDSEHPYSGKEYDQTLHLLQIELVKLQREIIASNDQILVIFEGRDAAGKDGIIKTISQHLSPREFRIVALGKPSERDRAEWYFQRYVAELPAAQEMVLFNRSWYNRAGVERVMGFCSDKEYELFMNTVTDFEQLLVDSGIKIIKYYLDISKHEQKERLEARLTDPLKQWKISPIDEQATKQWKQYSNARNEMLIRSHTPNTPWVIVHTDDKHEARINILRDLLGRLNYKGKDKKLALPDPEVVFAFDTVCIENGRLAP